MNLIVFGATGGTGRHVVAQALSAGHTVTAVARRPEMLNKTHEQLHVVRGDVFESATFIQALAGQDAVVSALGVRSQTPTTLFSAGVAQIMAAMHMHGVNRLVCISAGYISHVVNFTRVNERLHGYEQKTTHYALMGSHSDLRHCYHPKEEFRPQSVTSADKHCAGPARAPHLYVCAWFAQLSSQGFAGFRRHYAGCEQYL